MTCPFKYCIYTTVKLSIFTLDNHADHDMQLSKRLYMMCLSTLPFQVKAH